MYKLYFFFLPYMALSRTQQSKEPQAAVLVRMQSLQDPSKRRQPLTDSLSLLQDVAPSSSTLIPQGCCPCQIHAYLLWLLPLPDPPLFLMAVIPARSTLISYGCYPRQIHPYFLWLLHQPDPTLSLIAVTPARSTLISYGCNTGQIHPYL